MSTAAMPRTASAAAPAQRRTSASASRRRRIAAAATTKPRFRMPFGAPSLDSLNVDSSMDLDAVVTRNVREVSYVSRRRLETLDFDPDATDEEGLPLVYNEDRIAEFWRSRPGELGDRWSKFAHTVPSLFCTSPSQHVFCASPPKAGNIGVALPWLTSLASSFARGTLEKDQVSLARSAVANLEQLGPTFIKLGQILSIRPDVLPPAIMGELGKLQDNIEPFSTVEARRLVEADLGAPIDELFSEFSAAPIAAASLAQVYRARIRATGEEVAVKVQRPSALSTISKDLYVLRRGVKVYENLVKRFTAQTTDYQALLSTFAEGLYTEMDFRNEALNMLRMQELLDASEFDTAQVFIPEPRLELSSRRVLTMEWVTGVKLSLLPQDEIRTLSKVGQDVFLEQLLTFGFFHGDPHPGNLFKVTEGIHEGKLALLDFGLVAEIPVADREAMISATIHLSNRDWDALVSDFMELGFLPRDADRALIIPVMNRVLSPYLRGGGAKSFNFQDLSQDLLAVTLEIPFSVPPYMSLLARSVATLEGIALAGDPDYAMVAQAYPFVVRKVLRNDSSSSASILREILYDGEGKLKTTRLSTLLNAALGFVADAQGGFVDFDAVPEEGATLQEVVQFLLSKEAADLRPLLIQELTSAGDLFARDRARKTFNLVTSQLQPRLPFFGILPSPPLPPLYVPGLGFMPAERALDIFAPRLSDNENITLDTQLALVGSLLDIDPSDVGEVSLQSLQSLLFNPTQQVRDLQAVLGRLGGNRGDLTVVRETSLAVVTNLTARIAERAGVPATMLFGPALPALQRAEAAAFERLSAAAGPPSATVSGGAAEPAQPADGPSADCESASGSTDDGATPGGGGGERVVTVSDALAAQSARRGGAHKAHDAREDSEERSATHAGASPSADDGAADEGEVLLPNKLPDGSPTNEPFRVDDSERMNLGRSQGLVDRTDGPPKTDFEVVSNGAAMGFDVDRNSVTMINLNEKE